MISRPHRFRHRPAVACRRMEWDPWTELDRRPITMIWHRLPHALGAWMHTYQTIVMTPDQTETNARTTLAEEIAHADLDHRDAAGIEWNRQELRAKRLAAVRMVTVDCLAAALVGARSWFEVADSLDVDPDLLDIRVRDLTDDERDEVLRQVGQKEMGV